MLDTFDWVEVSADLSIFCSSLCNIASLMELSPTTGHLLYLNLVKVADRFLFYAALSAI